MSKHTPGPWNAFKYPDVKSWTVAAKESIASKIKTEPDAQLIAAAPELLADLEKLVEKMNMGECCNSELHNAIRAIKKAKGEL